MLMAEQLPTTVRRLSDEEYQTAALEEFPQTDVVLLGSEGECEREGLKLSASLNAAWRHAAC